MSWQIYGAGNALEVCVCVRVIASSSYGYEGEKGI